MWKLQVLDFSFIWWLVDVLVKKSEYSESESLPMLAELWMSSVEALDTRSGSSTSESGFLVKPDFDVWDQPFLVKLWDEDENGTISLAIISGIKN